MKKEKNVNYIERNRAEKTERERISNKSHRDKYCEGFGRII